MMIVNPVIVRPLTREWEETRARITGLLEGSIKPPKRENGSGSLKVMDAVIGEREKFLRRLRGTSVLDPACGSGNFLYLALHAIKDIENRALLECEALGLPPQVPIIGPEILHGIEISPLAAELARTTIWIGFIQWEIKNMVGVGQRPILRKLDNIECRDALITAVPSLPAGAAAPSPSPLGGEGAQRADEGALPSVTYVEAEWPKAEFIIGNPPFLGSKLLRRELGSDYVELLFELYEDRVPRDADLVTYWFEKTRKQIVAGTTERAGLVSTNSIRGGANRSLLARVITDATVLEAWSDEPWIVEGAAVRVSLICFGKGNGEAILNGAVVPLISADLTSADTSTVDASPLADNRMVSFQGPVLVGNFDIPGEVARPWLTSPLNPNGQSNAHVLRPLRNGRDINAASRDFWVIDFGRMGAQEASYFELPFEHAQREVKPARATSSDVSRRTRWWLHGRTGDDYRAAVKGLSRYIAGSQVSKHRIFVWHDLVVWPHQTVIAIARDDDTTFGILHSRFHESWSLRLGTSLEDRPRYTPTTTFETFPFPEGLTPNIAAADYASDPRAIRIAAAAKALDDARRAWLNPPDLVDIVPEIVPTAAPGEAPVKYPDRILPKSEEAAEKLKQRTLTKLYNARPQWLADLHDTLDRAVAAAYGWPEDITTDDALARLLALNLERAAAGR